jgi:hypothetical protein
MAALISWTDMAVFYRVRGVHTNRDPCLPDEPFLTSNLGTVRNDGVDGSDRYRSAGLASIAHDFYSGGRHEMLHEINRRDVITNLLVWISGLVNEANGSTITGRR